VMAAVCPLQITETVVAVVEKLTAVMSIGQFEHAATLQAPMSKFTLVQAAVAVGQLSHAMELALVEIADITIAAYALPGSSTVKQAVFEFTLIKAAVGVIEAALALQAPIDQRTAIAPAIGQQRRGGSRRRAVATGDQQRGKSKAQRYAHGRSSINRVRRSAVCRKVGRPEQTGESAHVPGGRHIMPGCPPVGGN